MRRLSLFALLLAVAAGAAAFSPAACRRAIRRRFRPSQPRRPQLCPAAVRVRRRGRGRGHERSRDFSQPSPSLRILTSEMAATPEPQEVGHR